MQAHVDYMDLVRQARGWIKARDEIREKEKVEPIAARTREAYKRQAERLVASGTIEGAVAAVDDTRSAATWFYRRAALISWADTQIRLLLADQDKLQRALRGKDANDPRWSVLRQTIKTIDTWRKTAEAISKPCPIPLKGRKRRHSKRKDLPGLPKDWKEQLLARLPKYRLIYLVASITGCRPTEITKGIVVIATRKCLECYIKGAKVSATKGQPLRALGYDYGTPLVDALRDEAIRHGGEFTVTLDEIKGPRQFSNAMAAAGMRLWPNRKTRVTPYMLRHQLSSDLKAAGRGAIEIAGTLGHVVTKTQTAYGHHKSGRGGVLPTSVQSARKPKETRNQKFTLGREPKSSTKAGSVKSTGKDVANGAVNTPKSVGTKRSVK